MASTGETWRLGHRPALDVVRAVAILAVVSGHTWPGRMPIALGGVQIFFTLSGFLITSLLLEERADEGRISMGGFYRRRARRLLPALFTYLLAAAAFEVAGGATVGWVVRQVTPALFYVENWQLALSDKPTGLMLHLWSLSVEEQFYAVFPVVLVLALRRGWSTLGGVLAVGCSASAVAWVIASHSVHGYWMMYGSDTNAGGLLIGCGLAMFMHRRSTRPARPVAAAFFIAAAAALGMTRWGTITHLVVPILTAAAIYLIACGPAPAWWENRVLVAIGRRSYALYLWHTPLAFGLLLGPLRAAGLSDWLAVPVFLSVAWLLTCLSWRYVERPFLLRAPVLQPEDRSGDLEGSGQFRVIGA